MSKGLGFTQEILFSKENSIQRQSPAINYLARKQKRNEQTDNIENKTNTGLFLQTCCLETETSQDQE